MFLPFFGEWLQRPRRRHLWPLRAFSGDSIGDSPGPSIAGARAEVLTAGVTINVLPILRPEDGRRTGAKLEAEYGSRIIGGPVAFVVTAESRATFAETVRRKLVLEIAGAMPGSPPADK